MMDKMPNVLCEQLIASYEVAMFQDGTRTPFIEIFVSAKAFTSN